MNTSYINAISPIDGRYYSKLISFRKIFSEYALIKFRVQVEIKWLIYLSKTKKIIELPEFNKEEKKFLKEIFNNFNQKDALNIKKIEKKINHDVKAVEYFIKKKLFSDIRFKKYIEFVHFACTSEDINNLSYAIILKKAKKNIISHWEKLIKSIKNLSIEYKNISMLSRTHGQPATPSTIGKEFANTVYRMQKQLKNIKKIKILGKFNGAVGNYNAHLLAYSNINWHKISKNFVNSLGIYWNPYTTQIEPHDYIAELFNCIVLFNTILIDFNRDIWGYISLNYFTQKISSSTEVGSSTMPHKINPIDFENAEGSLGISNAILTHMSNKLPISRWQRDLTDSTVLRSMGMSICYSFIAYQATIKGLFNLHVNKEKISYELSQNWEILSEPIQVLMRRYKISNSYEKLKNLTRGKKINKKIIHEFIKKIKIPLKEQKKLMLLEPNQYIGLSSKLVDELFGLNLNE